MKKIISGLFLGMILFATQVHADDTASLTLQQQYQQALTTLIGLLQKQVDILMGQLQQMQVSQKNIETKIDTVAQTVTPTNYGSVTTPVVHTPKISQLDVYIEKSADTVSYPHGLYMLFVSAKDQDGIMMKDVTVHFNNPEDNLFKPAPGDFDRQVSGSYGIENLPVASFQYIPSTSGEKTITFTAGEISTSTVITVQ